MSRYKPVPPTADQAAQLAAFARQPVTLVKLTVTGDVSSSQVFRFSSKEAPALTRQLGVDVRPYLRSSLGRPTRLRPEAALTERSSLTLTLADDPNAPAFSSAIFSVTTGGSFWRRLLVTQPDLIGSPVEILRGFIASGFDESDFERIFYGRLEEIGFESDTSVVLTVKDLLALDDRQVPPDISDTNLLDGGISASATTITVDDGEEFTDPADLASKDFFPVLLRLEPGAGGEEDVIVSGLSGNAFTVQQNLADKSEDFSAGTWTKSGGTTVTADGAVGPFGGPPKADLLTFASVGDLASQDTGVAASGETFVFSVWVMRGAVAAERDKITVDLILSDLSELASVEVELLSGWQRIQVSTSFTGGAGQTAVVRIRRGTLGTPDVYVFGAQCEKGTTVRKFYVATDGNAGADAGRGAFGSTAAAHSDGVVVKEIVLFRHQLANDGVHPAVALRDLVNRGGLAVANVDQDTFDAEFLFLTSTQVRRSGTTEMEKPRKLSEHVKDLRGQSLLDLWMGEDGKAKARFSFRPNQIGGTTSITDEENIVFESSSYDGNAESRVTRVFVYYGLTAGEEGDRPEDFTNVQVVVDLAVEDASGPRAKVIFAKWIFRQAEAIALAGRIIGRFRRGAKRARWELDLKDAPEFDVGDPIALDSQDLLVKSGSTAVRGSTFWQVTQKEERREDGRIRVEALEASGRMFAIIGPSGMPDYGSATDDDKQYGYIGDSNNLVDSGNRDGYYIL